MTRQRDELGLKEYPLYTHDEVDDIAPLFQGFRYNREVEWAAYEKSKAGFSSPSASHSCRIIGAFTSSQLLYGPQGGRPT